MPMLLLLLVLPTTGAYYGTARPLFGRASLRTVSSQRAFPSFASRIHFQHADGDALVEDALAPIRKTRAHVCLEAADGDSAEKTGRNWLPPRAERKKVLPLGLMFFFILFNYTILRDTKDVLMVTAPKSGAEVIPFLKTYVNLPGAIGFTALYTKLSNKYERDQVFYICIIPFLVFFGLFATVIYPNQVRASQYLSCLRN